MHTVVLLAHALNLAERLGYVVRQEWLEGNGGGGCELRGRKFLFIDLAAPPADQFDLVLRVLRGEPRAAELSMPQEAANVLRLARAREMQFTPPAARAANDSRACGRSA